MRIVVPLVLAAVCVTAASAQVSLQRLPNVKVPQRPVPSAHDIRVQSARDTKLIETPELCEAHNKFLREKALPALRTQLTQLQSLAADRKRHTFTCLGDSQSISGEGLVTDCGSFACNPIDGLCRTKAKTSYDCASGYYWVSSGACVPN